MDFGALHRRTLLARLVAGGLAFALAGCVETASEFNSTAAPRAKAPGIPVALISLEGAPETVISRLSSAIAQQAVRRDIQIVGLDGKPTYQLRGYVSAWPQGETGELSWAFDMFDAKRQRTKRFSGQEVLSRRGQGDVWTAISDNDLQKIAFKALDEVAEFLADRPAAVAANSPVSTTVRRSASLLAGQ